ncbi:MAG: beta-galactosidase, partial [Prolixibacteraceae bacterium]|nr:beta-galactosidase [Prolixibacteraceae bacterium]
MKTFGSFKSVSLTILVAFTLLSCNKTDETIHRERIAINNDWQFFKYASTDEADQLRYDVRPQEDGTYKDSKDADSRPDEAVELETSQDVLKAWILPSGNDFIADPAKRYIRPE